MLGGSAAATFVRMEEGFGCRADEVVAGVRDEKEESLGRKREKKDESTGRPDESLGLDSRIWMRMA